MLDSSSPPPGRSSAIHKTLQQIKIPFKKMHHGGNDFVIIDERSSPSRTEEFSAQDWKNLAERSTGIGCDQIVRLCGTKYPHMAHVRLHNADGGEVSVCGNAFLCTGSLLQQTPFTLITDARQFEGSIHADQSVTVHMGIPTTLLKTSNIPVLLGNQKYIGWAVDMGNPHLIFFHPDTTIVAALGQQLQTSSLFPEGINVSVAQHLHGEHYRIQTYERGVGLTKACGSAACATMYALIKRGTPLHQMTIHWEAPHQLHLERHGRHLCITGYPKHVFDGYYLHSAKAGTP